jgi:hypothetical protein
MLRSAWLFVPCLVLCAGKTVPVSTATTDTRASQPPHESYAFCDTGLPTAARVADLVGRLQGAEIPPQLTARHNGGGSPGPASNVSRLGIPSYDWGLNCEEESREA